MRYSFGRFGKTYCVYTGPGARTIMTSDGEFIHHVLQKNHRRYKKSSLSTETLGKYIGNGLLTAEGDYWLRQRRLIQPGFHLQKIRALYEIMDQTISKFLEEFPMGTIDVYPMMHKAAFQLVVDSLFDIDFPEEEFQELADVISDVQTFVIKEVRQPHLVWYYKLTGQVRKHINISARGREIIHGIIKERRESGKQVNDLLDMLLNARYEDTNEPMDDQQLIDEIFILIIAGHETTANALSWALYLLAEHPKIQTDLREKTRDLDIEQTVKNSDLQEVIQESMRLYPPAWISDRVALEDDEFGAFSFPGNSTIITVFRLLHRDPSVWESPDEFIPERFNKDRFTKEQSRSYYPFGAGPRLCIGNNFALAEMALFLRKFLQKFQLKSTGQKPKEIPLVTLRPDQVILAVERV